MEQGEKSGVARIHRWPPKQAVELRAPASYWSSLGASWEVVGRGNKRGGRGRLIGSRMEGNGALISLMKRERSPGFVSVGVAWFGRGWRRPGHDGWVPRVRESGWKKWRWEALAAAVYAGWAWPNWGSAGSGLAVALLLFCPNFSSNFSKQQIF